jgi:hypothetical protein
VVTVITVSSTFRVLADRHVEDALRAEQQDQEGDDGREDRPADEAFGEAHSSLS